MKLQTKINFRFLTLLLIIFVAAGVILYFVLDIVVNEYFDDTLKNKSKEIKKNLILDSSTLKRSELIDQSINIKLQEKSFPSKKYFDTLIYDSHEKEFINYRKMIFGIVSNGKNYEISIMLSKLETEDIVELIFYFMLGLFIAIVFILFFSNRWLSSSIWHPFYKTINELNQFKIDQKHLISLENSTIYEFDQLNKSLLKMVQKAQTDFKNLKEFTENASHEIQTPIAIIKSKLESVLQDKTLPSLRYDQIQSAYHSISRLSKLNEALLLLSKIENQQFPEITEIDLGNLITKQLNFIEELLEFKKIKVIINLQNPVIVKINTYLAEILINNLLGNAVKHNIENGELIITSNSKQLIISNTGKSLNINPDKIFNRFTKSNTGNESTGLGLAIASEICNISNLVLKYEYINDYHNLIINTNS